MLFESDIFAVFGEIERGFSLGVLAIAVGQLTQEMGLVPSFRPSLSQIVAD